jgi:tetratricopeptide (TPR) repeat protein
MKRKWAIGRDFRAVVKNNKSGGTYRNMTTFKDNFRDSASAGLLLYKYRSDNEYTERLFTTRRVWLSTAHELNDPFECSLQEIAAEWIQEKISMEKQAQVSGFIFSLRDAIERGTHLYGLPQAQLSSLYESIHSEKSFDVVYRRMRNFLELASVAALSNPEHLYMGIDDYLNSVGIFSMSECPDNALMWAHYGNHHTGICLGFLAAPGCILADPAHCLPVRYSSEVPTVPTEGLQTSISITLGANGKPISTRRFALDDPTFQAAISTKAFDWSYEQEWRYVETVGGDYPWPGPLSEITFGLRCPKQRRDYYTALAEEFAFGEVELFEILKVPNSNELKRSAVGKILGKRSPLPSINDDEPPIRVAAARIVSDQIEQLVRGGDFEQALNILDSQLEKDPNLWHALFQKGVTLGHMGKHESAFALFKLCCTLTPGDSISWYQQGVALTQLGKHTEAIQAYRKARELDPSDASTEFNLGTLLINCSVP